MVNENRVLTNSLYQEIFRTSRRTALRDLHDLIEVGQVRMSGVGKGAKYKAV
jgi:predicted HTH transcriptional regulator